MRTITLLTLAVLVGTALLQCSHSTDDAAAKANAAIDPPRTTANLTASETSLLNSSNRFGFKLFREIAASGAAGENIFISPLSASYALAMCYNAAAGETREEIASTLELAGLTPEDINESYLSLTSLLLNLDPAVEVNIANSLWYREGLAVKQEYIDLERTYFDAVVRGLDFNKDWAADTINAWVKAETRGKIDKIVKKPIMPDAVAYLINAIYFKGDWTLSFDTATTAPGPFYLADGSTVMVELMSCDTTQSYFKNDLFQAVDLPYGDGQFAMTILLPREGKTTGDILAEMSDANWAQWMGGFQEQPVPLYLPKFRLSYEVTLNQMLQAMGMLAAFAPGRADFANMVPSEGLYISTVKQKSFVQVDEQGTEAAAVTAVEFITVVADPELTMRVDHPFIFAVRERVSGTVLFIGLIAEPVWES